MSRRRSRVPGMRARLVVSPASAEPVAAIVAASRRAGCTCDPPNVEFYGADRPDGLVAVAVVHERGCPLLPKPTQPPARLDDDVEPGEVF